MPLDNSEDWPTTISAIVKYFGNQNDSRYLLHFDGPVHSSDHLKVELEVITVISSENDINPEEAFIFHNILPGKVQIPRTPGGKFILSCWPAEQNLSVENGQFYFPALIPAVTRHVGYLHTDLLARMPYFPVCHKSGQSLVVEPIYGGAAVKLEGSTIGNFYYWNWEWQPMHVKGMSSNCAIALMISESSYQSILGDYAGKNVRCWKVKVHRREKDYSEWSSETIYGMIN